MGFRRRLSGQRPGGSRRTCEGAAAVRLRAGAGCGALEDPARPVPSGAAERCSPEPSCPQGWRGAGHLRCPSWSGRTLQARKPLYVFPHSSRGVILLSSREEAVLRNSPGDVKQAGELLTVPKRGKLGDGWHGAPRETLPLAKDQHSFSSPPRLPVVGYPLKN